MFPDANIQCPGDDDDDDDDDELSLRYGWPANTV